MKKKNKVKQVKKCTLPYCPPRYAGALLKDALRMVEDWQSSVKAALSIGMVPPLVPGELIQVLTSLPNTLSPLEPIRGVDQPDSLNSQTST